MGKMRQAFTVTAALFGGVVALSGCTIGPPAPSPPSASVATAPSTAPAPDEAIIFTVQKSQVEKSATPGTVLKQYSGTGPATLHIPVLAKDQKQLGATVICSGTGEWMVRIVENGPGWGSSGCSLKGGNSMAYPVLNPGKESTVEVKVAADAKVWVTVFSTK
jgi:hypothetical protein